MKTPAVIAGGWIGHGMLLSQGVLLLHLVLRHLVLHHRLLCLLLLLGVLRRCHVLLWLGGMLLPWLHHIICIRYRRGGRTLHRHGLLRLRLVMRLRMGVLVMVHDGAVVQNVVGRFLCN